MKKVSIILLLLFSAIFLSETISLAAELKSGNQKQKILNFVARLLKTGLPGRSM